MPDLNEMLAKMVADVKSGKFKKKKAKGGKSLNPNILNKKVAAPKGVRTYTDECLVLVATTTICDSCGNEGVSWSNELYIQRIDKRLRNPLTSIERITTPAYSCTYGSLPKRIEMQEHHSPACPLCFGLGDNQGNTLHEGVSPMQLQLAID